VCGELLISPESAIRHTQECALLPCKAIERNYVSKPRKAPKPNVDEPESGGFRTALKWVAAVTALLSLVFGIYQFMNLIADSRERDRRIAELEKTAAVQQGESDYAAAWDSMGKALQFAESGGPLSKMFGQQSNEAQQANLLQENLAMAWIEDVRLNDGQKFSEVVDKIEPVLQRGVASASGSRKADLLAHVGWGIFLRQRDGISVGDPEQQYKEALTADPNNPYALANWGHWELWNNADQLESANRHFRAALASGTRARPYVRRIQLAALEDRSFNDDKCAEELLRQVDDMRRNGEPIDGRAKDTVWPIYSVGFGEATEESLNNLMSAVPPAEQVITFQALFYYPEFDSTKVQMRQVYLALLQEAAGECAQSHQTLAALGPQISPENKSLFAHVSAYFKCVSPQH